MSDTKPNPGSKMLPLPTRKPVSEAPNPGSKEAQEQGCICAVLDNRHGLGVPYPRDDGKEPNVFPSFYVTVGCPLHDERWATGRPDDEA